MAKGRCSKSAQLKDRIKQIYNLNRLFLISSGVCSTEFAPAVELREGRFERSAKRQKRLEKRLCRALAAKFSVQSAALFQSRSTQHDAALFTSESELNKFNLCLQCLPERRCSRRGSLGMLKERAH